MLIRPYAGTDEAQVLEVWNAAMTHDRISPAIFRTRVLLDPNFLPENLPVAVQDGRVVGFVLGLTRQVPLFLQGLEPGSAWITAFGVHPDYQRRGIARALFAHLLGRFRAEGRRSVGISPYVPNYFVPGVDMAAYPGTIAFLEQAAGFRILSKAISMGADLTGFQIPEDVLALERLREEQDGITIRPVTSADLPELMPFIVAHFGWDWFRHAQDYLLRYFGEAPHDICFLVAREHGAIVGYCQQRGERFGPFGVRPDCRNKGIGRLLLFRCLATMSAKHNYYAYFLWTGEDAARLYALAGFKKRREFAVLHQDLE
ncbi:MAG: GNAT family N-acetyltransferase [Anaerolineae bacterium]|nr:GNAT family N-acetyltransferase [Anaerolineae bacterium]